jgi:hypothetical protein
MKIGQEILKQAYIKELGITMKQLNNIPNTSRDYVQLKDCILKLVKFEDKTLQTLLETMKKDAQYFDEDGHTKDYSYSVKFSNKVYHIGSGGLHSDDEPCIYRASSKKKIIDFDVGSYYPSLIIEHKFTPEHLGKNLLNVYKDIYKQRLKAKKQKKKVEAETLKLALNGTFGQLLQKYS